MSGIDPQILSSVYNRAKQIAVGESLPPQEAFLKALGQVYSENKEKEGVKEFFGKFYDEEKKAYKEGFDYNKVNLLLQKELMIVAGRKFDGNGKLDPADNIALIIGYIGSINTSISDPNQARGMILDILSLKDENFPLTAFASDDTKRLVRIVSLNYSEDENVQNAVDDLLASFKSLKDEKMPIATVTQKLSDERAERIELLLQIGHGKNISEKEAKFAAQLEKNFRDSDIELTQGEIIHLNQVIKKLVAQDITTAKQAEEIISSLNISVNKDIFKVFGK